MIKSTIFLYILIFIVSYFSLTEGTKANPNNQKEKDEPGWIRRQWNKAGRGLASGWRFVSSCGRGGVEKEEYKNKTNDSEQQTQSNQPVSHTPIATTDTASPPNKQTQKPPTKEQHASPPLEPETVCKIQTRKEPVEPVATPTSPVISSPDSIPPETVSLKPASSGTSEGDVQFTPALTKQKSEMKRKLEADEKTTPTGSSPADSLPLSDGVQPVETESSLSNKVSSAQPSTLEAESSSLDKAAAPPPVSPSLQSVAEVPEPVESASPATTSISSGKESEIVVKPEESPSSVSQSKPAVIEETKPAIDQASPAQATPLKAEVSEKEEVSVSIQPKDDSSTQDSVLAEKVKVVPLHQVSPPLEPETVSKIQIKEEPVKPVATPTSPVISSPDSVPPETVTLKPASSGTSEGDVQFTPALTKQKSETKRESEADEKTTPTGSSPANSLPPSDGVQPVETESSLSNKVSSAQPSTLEAESSSLDKVAAPPSVSPPLQSVAEVPEPVESAPLATTSISSGQESEIVVKPEESLLSLSQQKPAVIEETKPTIDQAFPAQPTPLKAEASEKEEVFVSIQPKDDSSIQESVPAEEVKVVPLHQVSPPPEPDIVPKIQIKEEISIKPFASHSSSPDSVPSSGSNPVAITQLTLPVSPSLPLLQHPKSLGPNANLNLLNKDSPIQLTFGNNNGYSKSMADEKNSRVTQISANFVPQLNRQTQTILNQLTNDGKEKKIKNVENGKQILKSDRHVGGKKHLISESNSRKKKMKDYHSVDFAPPLVVRIQKISHSSNTSDGYYDKDSSDTEYYGHENLNDSESPSLSSNDGYKRKIHPKRTLEHNLRKIKHHQDNGEVKSQLNLSNGRLLLKKKSHIQSGKKQNRNKKFKKSRQKVKKGKRKRCRRVSVDESLSYQESDKELSDESSNETHGREGVTGSDSDDDVQSDTRSSDSDDSDNKIIGRRRRGKNRLTLKDKSSPKRGNNQRKPDKLLEKKEKKRNDDRKSEILQKIPDTPPVLKMRIVQVPYNSDSSDKSSSYEDSSNENDFSRRNNLRNSIKKPTTF